MFRAFNNLNTCLGGQFGTCLSVTGLVVSGGLTVPNAVPYAVFFGIWQFNCNGGLNSENFKIGTQTQHGVRKAGVGVCKLAVYGVRKL